MEKRIIFPRSGEVALEEFELKPPIAGQVVVRTLCSLISAGTESRCLSGNFAPGTHWDNWVKYPFQPGYSCVGQIEQLGEGVESLSIGDAVAFRGRHASAHCADGASCCPLPQGLAPETAVWFALAKIAFVGLQACGELLGKRVAVLGAGPIGQMAVRWANACGPAAIIAIDLMDSRLKAAAAGGADHIIAAPADEAVAIVASLIGEPEVVIDTTGNPLVFGAALTMAARKARVVILGDVGDPTAQHLTSDVIIKGLSIIGAHDCHSGGDWPAERMYRLLFSHIQSGRIDMAGLNTHSFRPDEAKAAYALAASRTADAIGIRFEWQ